MSSSGDRALVPGAVALAGALALVQAALGGLPRGGPDAAARAIDIAVLSGWLGTLGAVAILDLTRTGRAALPAWCTRLGRGSVVVLAASCLFQAARRPDPGGWYGALVLAKLALLGLALLGLARLGPALRRIPVTQAAAGVAVLVVSGAFAIAAPSAGAVTGSATAGDLVVVVSGTRDGFTVAVSSSRRPPPAPVSAATAAFDGHTVALRELTPGRFLGTGSLAGVPALTVVVRRGEDRRVVRVELEGVR